MAQTLSTPQGEIGGAAGTILGTIIGGKRRKKMRQEELERLEKQKTQQARRQFLEKIFGDLDQTQQRSVLDEFGIDLPKGEGEISSELSREALGLGDTRLSPEETENARAELQLQSEQKKRQQLLQSLGIKGASAAGLLESGFGEQLGVPEFGRSPVDIATEQLKQSQAGEREEAAQTQVMRQKKLQSEIDLQKQKKAIQQRKNSPNLTEKEKRLFQQSLANILVKQIDLLDEAVSAYGSDISAEEYRTQRKELSDELVAIKREMRKGGKVPETQKQEKLGVGFSAGARHLLERRTESILTNAQKSGGNLRDTIGNLYKQGVSAEIIEKILEKMGLLED